MLQLEHMLWKPHFLGTVQAPQGELSLPLFSSSYHADGELLWPITRVVSGNDLNQGLLTPVQGSFDKEIHLWNTYVCVYIYIYIYTIHINVEAQMGDGKSKTSRRARRLKKKKKAYLWAPVKYKQSSVNSIYERHECFQSYERIKPQRQKK